MTCLNEAVSNRSLSLSRNQAVANLRLTCTKTEKVHGRARAPSRQTRRVAAKEVRSRVPPRKGADLVLFSQTGISKRDVITCS
jgi:hypothetical protein